MLFIIEVMVLQTKAIQVIFYATMFYIINVNIKKYYISYLHFLLLCTEVMVLQLLLLCTEVTVLQLKQYK